uniref:C2H2-type domain-containing protein n=1 Tax=Timema genevievae TaxID=629358 RepID=A0A7R9JZ87_TIMGE|nr:unnamed protein product [Timema genevievae]
MNFSPFGGHFAGSIPTATMHQFATAKFAAHNMATAGGQVLGVLSGGEGGVHYLRPMDASGFTIAAQGGGTNNQQQQTLITLPISIAGKPGEHGQPQQTVQIQVVNPNATIGNNGATTNVAPKYHISPLSLQHFPQGVLTVAYAGQQQGGAETLLVTHGDGGGGNSDLANNNTSQSQTGSMQQSPVKQEHQQQPQQQASEHQGFAVVAHIPPELILRDVTSADIGKGDDEHSEKDPLLDDDKEKESQEDFNGGSAGQHPTLSAVPASWQSIAAPGTTIADYLSRLQGTSLPLNLHHFLKFSAETIKREAAIESSPLSNPELVDPVGVSNPDGSEVPSGTAAGKQKKKKKYKKKPPKPRRPRPGQVHIATALDGTTLFCCPECHMAYPEKELLEAHLVGHKIERRSKIIWNRTLSILKYFKDPSLNIMLLLRNFMAVFRFICDICGAGLKRKEHLERHKLGHNPDRPFLCSVCHKGFKRKEHLNLHFVIHSGHKSEVCPECGKGFYRKDHLRKHARSHLAKRVKEELANQQQQHQLLQEQQQQQKSVPVTMYSAENIKKESDNPVASTTTPGLMVAPATTATKKKKKKKPSKEKKPRPKPGEIRLTTALDGSTLYCCPECHMAYPEKDLLEQHLLGHTLERRFVCDICGAGLKRKDHLTRHKQSHNPERPYVCTVCLKAFKRKEQLTLHFVIHSGEKRHVCTECGKGFYRKDHLRKHTRSHIARRVKAELSQHAPQAQHTPGHGQPHMAGVSAEQPPPPLLS